jgi:propanediol dehydratase small subunit
MNWVQVAMIVLVAAFISLVIGLPGELKRRKLMAKYWARTCTGREWKRRFPTATSDEIREFLNEFVDGFAYSTQKRLKFSPSDKIMDVYHSEYPVKGVPDALELKTFAMLLEKRYGVDLARVLRPDLTLGDLFAMIRIQGDCA